MSERVAVYVDGFNLYHAIKHYQPNKINLWSLFEDFKKPSETLVSVKYFSAYAYWLPKKTSHHKKYVKDLKATGVDVVLGQFKNKPSRCHSCDARWVAHEEKETDINIALALLEDATDDVYDRAYLVSADSDLVAAVRSVRNRTDKEIMVVPPPGYLKNARDLCRSVRTYKELPKAMVQRNVF